MMGSSMLNVGVALGQMEGFFLVGWWYAILVLPPVLGWAWLVSSVFDKHAARFYLGREKWNLVHMLFGVAAVASIVLMPVPGIVGFLVGYGVMLALLAINVGVFVLVTNRDDERVPAGSKLRLDFSKFKEQQAVKAAKKHAATVSLAISRSDKTTLEAPAKESPEYEVRIASEQFYIAGARLGAYELDLAPSKDGYQVSYLVDGVRQAGEKMPATSATSIIDFWKDAARLDVKDRRRKLVGSVIVKTEVETATVRVTSLGSQSGMRLTLTLNPSQAVKRKADQLGLLDQQFEVVRTVAADGDGVVLLGAPNHNGRTTTLYAMLKLHDAYTSNVQTVEMDPQDTLEGIRQITFDPYKEGSEYSVTVRSVLRRDPDVVGIAELPDEATAREIAGADIERTRIYVSLNVADALAAVQVFVKAVGDPNKAANCLRGVVAQKLARKLCENCRVPYAPTGEMLKTLGLPADKVKQLFKKGGQVLIRNKPEICPVCQGIGYKGQTGLFEVFRIGPAERELIKAQNWSGLRGEFRKQGLPSLSQTALRKAVEGTTSIEEITRISSPGGGGKPSGGSGGGSAAEPGAQQAAAR